MGERLGGLITPSPPSVRQCRLGGIMTGNGGSNTDWWLIPEEGNTSLASCEDNPAAVLWDNIKSTRHRWKEMCFHLPIMSLFSVVFNGDYTPHKHVFSPGLWCHFINEAHQSRALGPVDVKALAMMTEQVDITCCKMSNNDINKQSRWQVFLEREIIVGPVNSCTKFYRTHRYYLWL